MTTAAVEVAIMSKLSNRTIRIIKKLKVLKNLFFTLPEGVDFNQYSCHIACHRGISQTTRFLQHMIEMVEASIELVPKKSGIEVSEDSPVGRRAHDCNDKEDAKVDLQKFIYYVREIQKCWFKQNKTPESSELNFHTARASIELKLNLEKRIRILRET